MGVFVRYSSFSSQYGTRIICGNKRSLKGCYTKSCIPFTKITFVVDNCICLNVISESLISIISCDNKAIIVDNSLSEGKWHNIMSQ